MVPGRGGLCMPLPGERMFLPVLVLRKPVLLVSGPLLPSSLAASEPSASSIVESEQAAPGAPPAAAALPLPSLPRLRR